MASGSLRTGFVGVGRAIHPVVSEAQVRLRVSAMTTAIVAALLVVSYLAGGIGQELKRFRVGFRVKSNIRED